MSDSLHGNAGSLLCTQPLSRVGNANSGSLCVVILSCYLESIMGFPDLLWGLLRPEQGAGQGPSMVVFPYLRVVLSHLEGNFRTSGSHLFLLLSLTLSVIH